MGKDSRKGGPVDGDDESKRDAASTVGADDADDSSSGTGKGTGTNVTRRGFIAATAATAAAIAVTKEGTASAQTGSQIQSSSLFRVHPAIGIARVGNADPSTFFIGPEVPGYPALPDPANGSQVPNYKDANGLVKPQAARFRIFEYRYVNGRLTPVQEITINTPGVKSITWTVQLANKKASFYTENASAGDSTSGMTPVLPATGLRNASVANRKSLENNFGPRSISGASQGPVTFSANPSDPSQSVVIGADGKPVIDYMGQLRTDGSGRLIVIGGKGIAKSSTSPPTPLTHWSNNDNWFDDVGDGPVTATITLTNNQVLTLDGTDPTSGKAWVGSAWVLVTPPRPAPSILAPITLYDTLTDVAVRFLPYPKENILYDDGGPLANVRKMQADFTPGTSRELPTYVPDFQTEINPILVSGLNCKFVTELANQKMDSLADASLSDPSDAAAKDRFGVYSYMRTPLGVPTGTGQQGMPRLRGDDPYQGQSLAHYTFAAAGPGVQHGGSPPGPADYASPIRSLPVTHVQLALLGRWSDGFFTTTGVALSNQTPVVTPHGLDRAALENTIGGAFCPGIEVGWQVRNPALFAEPFRLNPKATSQYLDQNGKPEGIPMAAGHFSRQQALPWHCDFNDCRTEGSYGWWPSARPTAVFLNPTDSLNQRVDWSRPTAKFPSGSTYSGYDDMIANWWKFGFLAPAAGGTYIESERAAQIP